MQITSMTSRNSRCFQVAMKTEIIITAAAMINTSSNHVIIVIIIIYNYCLYRRDCTIVWHRSMTRDLHSIRQLFFFFLNCFYCFFFCVFLAQLLPCFTSPAFYLFPLNYRHCKPMRCDDDDDYYYSINGPFTLLSIH